MDETVLHTCSENKGADQICVFAIVYVKVRFAHGGAHTSLVVRKPAFLHMRKQRRRSASR